MESRTGEGVGGRQTKERDGENRTGVRDGGWSLKDIKSLLCNTIICSIITLSINIKHNYVINVNIKEQELS